MGFHLTESFSVCSWRVVWGERKGIALVRVAQQAACPMHHRRCNITQSPAPWHTVVLHQSEVHPTHMHGIKRQASIHLNDPHAAYMHLPAASPPAECCQWTCCLAPPRCSQANPQANQQAVGSSQGCGAEVQAARQSCTHMHIWILQHVTHAVICVYVAGCWGKKKSNTWMRAVCILQLHTMHRHTRQCLASEWHAPIQDKRGTGRVCQALG